MKVIIFCGGLGMRLREYSEAIPSMRDWPVGMRAADFLRKIVQLMRDAPFVEHLAQRFHGPVKISALLPGKTVWRQRVELFPTRFAAQQLAIPPNRARIQRFLFGLRYRRQDAAC